MSRRRPVFPTNIPTNPKRGQSKLKRGFGKLAMEKMGASESEWCQKFDPLFKVKGIERHKRIYK